MEPVTIESIHAARQRISDVIYHSPCPYSLSLSRLCKAEVYCKLDHLQVTGSFKERGARNKLKLLKESNASLSGGMRRAQAMASCDRVRANMLELRPPYDGAAHLPWLARLQDL